jgi:hypothetical protein
MASLKVIYFTSFNTEVKKSQCVIPYSSSTLGFKPFKKQWLKHVPPALREAGIAQSV